MKQIKIISIFVIPLIVTMLNSCGPAHQASSSKEAIPVKTAAVIRQELSIPIITSGRLYPKTMIKLSLKVGGIIGEIDADEGETVKKGQLLAQLNPAEINARFQQAKNGWLKAQRDLERTKNLYNDRAATLEQLQNVKTAYEVAKSDLKIARFNLEHSRIKAPANGKILKRLAEEGEMTGAGTPIFIFGSTDNQWVVKVGISERDIVRMALKDSVTVRFDAYPGRDFNAVASEIPQAIDSSSGTYEVEIQLFPFDEENYKLAAGFVAKAIITPSAKEEYYVIPVDSIVEGEGKYGTVFSLKDEKAYKVNIEVAHIFPKTVAVRSGLKGIGKIITSGAAYLRDGSTVQVIK